MSTSLWNPLLPGGKSPRQDCCVDFVDGWLERYGSPVLWHRWITFLEDEDGVALFQRSGICWFTQIE